MRAAEKQPIRRVGGRSARVVEDVLRATLEEIARVGYAQMRVEEVAASSGVNKTTIYRRWPTKLALVAAAMHTVKFPHEFENTGDLQRDLVEGFVAGLARSDTPMMRGLIRMVLTERDDPELSALLRGIREEHVAARSRRLHAAVKDGSLAKSTDIELLQNVLSSAIYGRLTTLGERVSRAFVEKVVALVLAGAGKSPK